MIGHPVGHSRSPAMHNAAFAALGLDWTYLAFDVEPGSVAEALDGVRALGIRGLSVTMPHKEVVAAVVDEVSPVVEALGAANTVVRLDDGTLRGDNTDAAGFLASLVVAGSAADPTGKVCLVRGAGGAARAVVWGLAKMGAAEVVVVPGHDRSRAEAAATLAGGVGRVGTMDDVAEAAIVVNATPLGLGYSNGATADDGGSGGGLGGSGLGGSGGSEPLPINVDLVGPGQVVVDLVPHPSTPLLVAATARGAVTIDGLGMLVQQAALAFRLWTGLDAPVEAMRDAAYQ